jgi:HK97 family phage portal protein
MDLLARLFGGSLQASYPPDHDFWYGPAGRVMTAAGVRIDAESAQKVSAYFRGVDILSTSLAMLPLGVYRRSEDGRESVRTTLFDVVGRKPNHWQDSFQWRRQQVRHLIHHGNGYSRIVAGSRGFLDQLWPIHPTLVTPRQIPSGRLLYDVREPKTGQTTTYTQDEIFHLRGVSDDGIAGKGVLDFARDSLGHALALEGYAGTLFSRGALHSGVIEHPGTLDDDASKRMARSFMNKTAGAGNWHVPAVLEQGTTWKPSTMTPEQAQMLLSRKFSVVDIARWLGLPPHMLAEMDRATFNNIEHQGQEFVTYSLGSWLTLFEAAISDQLIIQTDTYYAEFTRDALVRGDIQARWAAYMQAVTTGTFTRNEVRELENRNKLPGLDEPLDPTHLTGGGGAANDKKPSAKPSASTKAQAIAVESASRLLRKEVTAVQKLAVRHAADQDAFATAVTDFYAKHAALVSSTLQMSDGEAAGYCAGQAAQIVNGDWIASVETWQSDHYAAGLAEMALEAA